MRSAWASARLGFGVASRMVMMAEDPSGANRRTLMVYGPSGLVNRKDVSEGGRTESVSMFYDFAGRLVSSSVDTGTEVLVSSVAYDERGNQVSSTDPRGNMVGADPEDYTTTARFDVLSRPVEVSSPPVLLDGGPGVVSPSVAVGYDTFGSKTHTRDANSNVTVYSFDLLGRLVRVDHPAYTQPGVGGVTLTPFEVFSYDRVGNKVSEQSRNGHVTEFVFDSLNRPVAQIDPLVTGESSRGVSRVEYDDVGNTTATVDARGGRVEYVFDALNLVRYDLPPVSRTGCVC